MANLDNDLVEQAVAALMVRWQLAFDEREEQRKIIREAEERAARLTQVISDAQIGIRAFGLDPNDKEQKAEMNRRYNAAYFRALRKAKGLPEEDLLARVAAPEGKTEPEPKQKRQGKPKRRRKFLRTTRSAKTTKRLVASRISCSPLSARQGRGRQSRGHS